MTDLTIPESMGRAFLIGEAAGLRGYATLDDLKLSALDEKKWPGVADAYLMGVESGRRLRADPFAGCPQMPEEGVTPPPVATNNKRG